MVKPNVPPSEWIIDVGGYRQLFIDDTIVETSRWITPRANRAIRFTRAQPATEEEEFEGRGDGEEPTTSIPGVVIKATQYVARQHHQPELHDENPILVGDKPWEGLDGVHQVACPIVLFDEQEHVWKMWYHSQGSRGYFGKQVEGYKNNLGWYVLYATSQDGIHWDKPTLGVCDVLGYEGTNVVRSLPHPSSGQDSKFVFKDLDEADPERRYKGFDSHRPMSPIYSPDGIHWTKGPTVPRVGDECSHFVHDPWNLRFITFTRNQYKGSKFMMSQGQRTSRWIYTAFSTDLCEWTQPELIFAPDREDPFDLSFYEMSGLAYEGMYIGFLHRFNTSGLGISDTIDVELVSSRDGLNWQRTPSRKPFIPLGPEGSWNAGMVFVRSAVVHGDEIRFYLSGSEGAHGQSGRGGSIGLATLRRDRFVSLAAPEMSDRHLQMGRTPTLLTKPLYSTGRQLAINAEAEGSVHVELLDMDGRVRKGFGRGDCDPFAGGSVDHVVHWQGRSDLNGLWPSRIRFYLERARIFSL